MSARQRACCVPKTSKLQFLLEIMSVVLVLLPAHEWLRREVIVGCEDQSKSSQPPQAVLLASCHVNSIADLDKATLPRSCLSST